jgi:hypothetical protein
VDELRSQKGRGLNPMKVYKPNEVKEVHQILRLFVSENNDDPHGHRYLQIFFS